MYTVPFDILMEMTEVLPHQELLTQGRVVQFTQSLGKATAEIDVKPCVFRRHCETHTIYGRYKFPKINSSHLKICHPKTKLVLQLSCQFQGGYRVDNVSTNVPSHCSATYLLKILGVMKNWQKWSCRVGIPHRYTLGLPPTQ